VGRTCPGRSRSAVWARSRGGDQLRLPTHGATLRVAVISLHTVVASRELHTTYTRLQYVQGSPARKTTARGPPGAHHDHTYFIGQTPSKAKPASLAASVCRRALGAVDPPG
jgi:hypothetical protein